MLQSSSRNTAVRNNELDQLRSRVTALETLLDVAREVSAELDLEALLKKILRAAILVSQSTAGSLLLHDASSNELVFQVVIGGGGEALKDTRLPADKGIAGESFTRQRAIVVQDAGNDPRHFSAPADSVGVHVRQLVAVPLVTQGKSLGVLEVMNRATGERYSQDDVDLLMAFAAQSAIAIENARLYGQVLQERDRILAVEAAVRQELARDLHDGPAQLLSALVMNARFIQELVRRYPDRVPDEIEQLEKTAERALHQTRNILFDLRPLVLEQQGLGPALEQYAARLKSVEDFAVTLNAPTLRRRFDSKMEGAIFSIVQEAVNNAKKHADAKNVWIEGKEDAKSLTITIRDDGRGFDVSQMEANSAKRGSLGLLNMRERAEIAYGDLQIRSAPGGGTTVTLRVPLS
jgi:signal transduction histidine kinase